MKLDISYFSNEIRGQDQGMQIYSLFNVPFKVADLKDVFYFVKRIKIDGRSYFKFKEGRSYFEEPNISAYEFLPGIFDLDGVYFNGYWQNAKYLNGLRRFLLRTFSFKEIMPDDTLNYHLLKEIKITNSVSMHVRRGDYLHAANLYPLDTEYYLNAIELIRKTQEDIKVFVFSDDINWAKNNFIGDIYIFVDHNKGKDNYKDMLLMSICSHNIIANSSFSWWGAWLNKNRKKIVIAPTKWLNVDIEHPFLPNEWLLL